jgi:hypothetical protein
VGSKDISSSATLEWKTNCAQETIDLYVRFKVVNRWLAIALHDAGTANAPIAAPNIPMQGADIFIFSAEGEGSFLDASADGDNAPTAKTTSGTTLLSLKVDGSTLNAHIQRPWTNAGVSLAPERFVWLLTASTRKTDISAIYNHTHIFPERLSFFGGVAETTIAVLPSGMKVQNAENPAWHAENPAAWQFNDTNTVLNFDSVAYSANHGQVSLVSAVVVLMQFLF